MVTTQRITYEKAMPGTESRVNLPAHIGRGDVKFMGLSSGIQVKLSDFTLNVATRFDYTDFPPAFGFAFFLHGSAELFINGGKKTDIVPPGLNATYHFQEQTVRDIYGPQRISRLVLMIEPREFQALLGETWENMLATLRHLPPSRLFLDRLTPDMRSGLMQLINCPYEGKAHEFFLESKILELMVYKLDQLNAGKSRPDKRLAMKAENIDKARHAGQLLAQHLEAPPSISELAGQAEMSQSGLYRSFKAVYGVTPFDYLKHKRMETAQRLLDQNEMTVTQAACAVGYTSLSHFGKAFRAHTGYSPKQYLQRMGRKGR